MRLFACKNVPALQYSLFSYQVFQGCHHFGMLQMQKKEKKKKGKNGWITNRLFQLPCSFCLSFSRATLLKIGVMIVCVCVCVCVCKSAYVCLHRCQKKSSPVHNMCLCWESEREWLSTWEQSGTTVSLVVYNHSLKQSVDHADSRNTARVWRWLLSNRPRPENTVVYLLCLTHGLLFMPIVSKSNNKHDAFTLRDWHQLKQKTSVGLVQVNHFAQATKL